MYYLNYSRTYPVWCIICGLRLNCMFSTIIAWVNVCNRSKVLCDVPFILKVNYRTLFIVEYFFGHRLGDDLWPHETIVAHTRAEYIFYNICFFFKSQFKEWPIVETTLIGTRAQKLSISIISSYGTLYGVCSRQRLRPLHAKLGADIRIEMALQMGALRETFSASQATEVLLTTALVSANRKQNTRASINMQTTTCCVQNI